MMSTSQGKERPVVRILRGGNLEGSKGLNGFFVHRRVPRVQSGFLVHRRVPSVKRARFDKTEGQKIGGVLQQTNAEGFTIEIL